MKNILLSIIVLALFAWALPVLAQPVIGIEPGGMTQKVGQKSNYNINVTETTLSERVGQIIKAALLFVGTIFLALTIYAGFLWMTAGGKEEQIETATKILKAAVIGLIIIVAAYSITTFVMFTLS